MLLNFPSGWYLASTGDYGPRLIVERAGETLIFLVRHSSVQRQSMNFVHLEGTASLG